MATDRSIPSEIDEGALNDALITPPADELHRLGMQQRRRMRIDEYEEEAVDRTNPHDAVMGMGDAYLQRVFEHLGSAILEEFDTRPPTIEDIRERGPEIRLLVKLRNTMQPYDGSQQSGIAPPGQGRRQLDTKGALHKRDASPPRWAR